MVKIMLIKFNATGRKFICLNKKPGLLDDDDFAQHFKAGETYLEAALDSDYMNAIEPDEDVLLLLTRDNLTLYVDANDFVLSREEVHPLALQRFCIN